MCIHIYKYSTLTTLLVYFTYTCIRHLGFHHYHNRLLTYPTGKTSSNTRYLDETRIFSESIKEEETHHQN